MRSIHPTATLQSILPSTKNEALAARYEAGDADRHSSRFSSVHGINLPRPASLAGINAKPFKPSRCPTFFSLTSPCLQRQNFLLLPQLFDRPPLQQGGLLKHCVVNAECESKYKLKIDREDR